MERFDAIADEYDNWSLIDPHYEPLHDFVSQCVLLEIAAHKNSEPPWLLEIGFGTGNTTVKLLEANPTLSIYGIEISEPMFTMGQEHITREHLHQRTILTLGNATKALPGITAPNSSGLFKIAGSVCTMHNIEDPADRPVIIQEAFRLLEPGGMYISGDKVACDDLAAYIGMFDNQIRAMELYRERGMDHAYDFWRLHELEDHINRITETETLDMVREVGFEKVETLKRFGLYTVTVGYKPA